MVNRFALALGKRFTRENLTLLSEAHSAVSGLKAAASIIKGRGVNIFTQWVGDPDALGSAVMLEAILRSFGASDVRILTGILGHPQNRHLVERCEIKLHHPNEGRIRGGLHCMVDSAPPLGRASTGEVEPVAQFFFVADHHASREDVEAACRNHGVTAIRLAYAGLPVGSTSAFLAVIGDVLGVVDGLGPKGRAAAALGIYTDTNALLHGATPLDFRMFERLTRDTASSEMLDELRDYRVSPTWYKYRSGAFLHMQVEGGVRIAPAGWVSEHERDVIAEIADELLRITDTSIGIAVAVTQRGTEVSVRADSRLLGKEPERIVRVIDHLLQYTFPGCSGFKYDRMPPFRVEGGACVPHDASTRIMWDAQANGEIDPDDPAVLRHCEAAAKAMITALDDLKFARPEEIEGLL